MTDEIVKELPGWFVDRMREWSRAILFPDASNVPSAWPSDGPMQDSSGFHKARIPRMLGRAHETDLALSPPPGGGVSAEEYVQPRYAWAVRRFWLFEGMSARQQGKAYADDHGRARGIKHDTFKVWVREGHKQLMEIFERKSELWKSQHHANYVTRQACEGKLAKI